MSKDPKEPPQPPMELFPYDEMSTGETSSLVRRVQTLTGSPDAPVPSDPALKPMTGAQLAFRPSAPPRTGTTPALKPGTGSQPVHQPTGKTGTQPAFAPGGSKTGTQPAYVPGSKTGAQPAFTPSGKTGTQPAFSPATPASRTGSFKPLPPRPEPVEPPEPERAPEEEPHPVFDAEKLQRQIRAMSLTDSAHGLTCKPALQKTKPGGAPAPEDTFTKQKMKQAESNMPDFDLDEDLG